MVERSKRINMYDEEKMKQICPETLKLFKKYKMDMSIRELSEKTIHGYECDLNNWFIYILDNQFNQCITELNEDDITEFFYFCKQEGNNSRRIKRRMASISAFYKYLRKKRIIKENPMEFIDRPKNDTVVTVQTFLTEQQVKLMKEKLKEKNDKQMELYALLSLSTMGRVNAISNVKWSQVDYENRTINDVLEKEGKIVTFYFNKECEKLLKEIYEERQKEGIDNEYVFAVKYGGIYKKATVDALFMWCKKIGQMIDVPTLHPHDFRHSNAQLLKIRGCPIETISELLNHSGLDVTKKHYLTQDKQQMRKEKDKYEI